MPSLFAKQKFTIMLKYIKVGNMLLYFVSSPLLLRSKVTYIINYMKKKGKYNQLLMKLTSEMPKLIYLVVTKAL